LILKLVPETDPILHKTIPSWSFDGTNLHQTISDMTETMLHYNGIGIAAPQVGLSIRLFVIGTPDNIMACINPEIIEEYNLVKNTEGCLSFPNLYLPIVRHNVIRVRYQDEYGTFFEKELSGIMAVAFQHELDHLNGITFNDKVSNLVLTLGLKKRKKKLR